MTTDPGAWIAQEQAIAAAATDGPWEAYDERAELEDARPMWVLGRMDERGDWMHDLADFGSDPEDRANATFTEHARTGYPLALDVVAAILALCDLAERPGMRVGYPTVTTAAIRSAVRAAITDRIGGGQ